MRCRQPTGVEHHGDIITVSEICFGIRPICYPSQGDPSIETGRHRKHGLSYRTVDRCRGAILGRSHTTGCMGRRYVNIVFCLALVSPTQCFRLRSACAADFVSTKLKNIQQ